MSTQHRGNDVLRFIDWILSAVLLSVTAIVQIVPANARSLVEGFGRFELQAARGGRGHEVVRFQDGSRAERFTLEAGDCGGNAKDCNIDRERIEFFQDRPAQKVGTEHWVAWSVMLAPDFPIPRGGGEILGLGQFHQYGPSGPELIFQLQGGNYELKMTNPTRLDDDPMNPLPDFKRLTLLSGNSMKGRWTRVVVNVRWSQGADGFIAVWVNGKKKFDYTGPTTNANEPIYFKYDRYRSWKSRCNGECPSLIAYYREVKRGNSKEAVE